MSYETLISRLTEDLKPVRRRRLGVEVIIVLLICAIELALFFHFRFARSDMPMMMKQPTFWWRLISLGLISVLSGALALLSFNPAYSPGRGIRWVGLIIAICLVFGLCINGGPGGLDAIIHRISWMHGIVCAGKMIALSMPLLIGLGLFMRRGAPTHTKGTSLLVGLAAAAWGAFVFVFACPFNDPLYIALWYSVGCGAVTLISRFALPYLARW
jgi:hypothetical protein